MSTNLGQKTEKQLERERRLQEQESLRDAILNDSPLAPMPAATIPPLRQPVGLPGVPYEASPEASTRDTVTIEDSKVPVKLTVSYRYGEDSRDVEFSVGFLASNVQVTSDYVSLVMREDIQIFPPGYCALRFEVDGEVYDVLYTGIAPVISGMKFMSFINVTK